MSIQAKYTTDILGSLQANRTSRSNPIEQNPRLVELQKEKEELIQKKETLMGLLERTETLSERNDRLMRWRDDLLPKLYVRPASLQPFKVSQTKPVSQDLGPSEPSTGSTNDNTKDEASHNEQRSDSVGTATEGTVKHALQRPLSDNLRLDVPFSGKVYIDPYLTVNFKSKVPKMQLQIYELRKRLRSSYPRIDTLPYKVWRSRKKNTLRIWLKILVTRWQNRFYEPNDDDNDVDQGLRQVLDLMVRKHDLSNEAAERMAMRWHQVFDRRRSAAKKEEEDLNWEEYEAGGMGFLMDENTASDKEKHEEKNEEKELTMSQAAWTSSTFATQRKTTVFSPLNTTRRLYSTRTHTGPHPDDSTTPPNQPPDTSPAPTLPHLTPTGSAHMVSVSSKAHTTRTAIAVGTVYFSNPTPLSLIRSNSVKKGDVLSVSRIAGIMAAKKCPDLIPLCHPIALSHVGVELCVFASEGKTASDMGFGGVRIEAKVQCTGPTGVEMEALTSVMGAALSVVDMCKAVDKFQRVQDVRVVLKEGGKSGVWREEGWKSWQE